MARPNRQKTGGTGTGAAGLGALAPARPPRLRPAANDNRLPLARRLSLLRRLLSLVLLTALIALALHGVVA